MKSESVAELIDVLVEDVNVVTAQTNVQESESVLKSDTVLAEHGSVAHEHPDEHRPLLSEGTPSTPAGCPSCEGHHSSFLEPTKVGSSSNLVLSSEDVHKVGPPSDAPKDDIVQVPS